MYIYTYGYLSLNLILFIISVRSNKEHMVKRWRDRHKENSTTIADFLSKKDSTETDVGPKLFYRMDALMLCHGLLYTLLCLRPPSAKYDLIKAKYLKFFNQCFQAVTSCLNFLIYPPFLMADIKMHKSCASIRMVARQR